MQTPTRLQTLLKAKVGTRNWADLATWLEHLSHRDFKQACLAFDKLSLEDISADDLLGLFAYLVPTNPKAYLVTLLKVVVVWAQKGVLSVDHPLLLGYATQIGEKGQVIDITKFATHIFPLLPSPQGVEQYIQALGLVEGERQTALLCRFDTLPCRFVLFQCLRRYEHDVAYIKRVMAELRKQASTRDYNFLAFLTLYFGIEERGMVYSLQLSPHELGRVEGSYAYFTQLMTRV